MRKRFSTRNRILELKLPKMRNTADLESAGENLSALEPFQGPEMDKGYLEDLAIMAVSTDRRGIDRKRWRATRRTVLARDQYRCRKDELAAGAQGKPVKALSPNGRGGTFTGRRQTAATPLDYHTGDLPACRSDWQLQPHASHQDRSIANTQASHTIVRLRRQPAV